MTPPESRRSAMIQEPDVELDAFLEAFEMAAGQDPEADLADFLPPAGHPKYQQVLRELVRVDLEFAWDRGEERRLEVYRGRFPALFANREPLAAIAREEYRLRKAAGQDVDPLEYLSRFGIDLFERSSEEMRPTATRAVPELLDSGANHVFWNRPAGCDWPAERVPQVGDTIPPGFELLSELGRGTFGRVYLASQADLEGRPVAVKLSSRLVGESRILARLQHTNIVPVYSVHQVGRFQALVMPYLGRTTLADLLTSLESSPSRPASGKSVVSTLADKARITIGPSSGTQSSPADRTEAPGLPLPPGLSRTTLANLSRFSFVEAVLWIGAELADGLAHAHDRGILHRDLKPANVLLTDDGRPMLLDFNLATDTISARNEPAVCGTLRFMAPEQLAGLRIERGTYTVQTDIYALGLILLELLAGKLPFSTPHGSLADVAAVMERERTQTSLVGALPKEVSPAVASILDRCLAPDPQNRYRSASELREDLQRQLTNQPLEFAPERSMRERIGKWSRRHPRLSSMTTLGAVASLGLVIVVAGFLFRQRTLEQFETWHAREELRAGRDFLQSASLLANSPLSEIEEFRSRASRALAPYRVADEGWFSDGLVTRLPPGEQTNLRLEVAEVLFRAAESSFLLASQEANAGEKDALMAEAREQNRRALHAYPGNPPRTLLAQKARLQGTASSTKEAMQTLEASGSPEPATPWDLLQEGRFAQAREALWEEGKAGPPRYGVWMGIAATELKLGHKEPAIEALSMAAGVAPRQPWPFYHRGVARLERGQFEDARRDFDRFLDLRKQDSDGYLNRAICRLRSNDARGAVADLDEAERLGTRRTRIYAIREQARRRLGDTAGADRDRATFLAKTPTDPLSWTVRGELEMAGSPPDTEGARRDFDSALALDPGFVPALRSKASLLSEHLGRPAEAVSVLDQVLAQTPEAWNDRAGRAVLLARLGRQEEARREAARVAEKSTDALTLYQAASVYFLAPRGANDITTGLALLRSTLRKDLSWGRHMRNDPDLRSVQANPRFRSMMKAVDELMSEE